MFAFLQRRRDLKDARTKIGVDLHRQVVDAFEADDFGAAERLSSTFTVGYIHAFIRDSFYALGVDVEASLDAQIQHICDGVIPGKLHKIYSDQGAALLLARRMKNQSTQILNTGLSPSDVTNRFVLGTRAGTHDAPLVSLDSTAPGNLRRYLLNEALEL